MVSRSDSWSWLSGDEAMSTYGVSMSGETGVGEAGTYEPPQLTPIGNLKDLLAATTGSTCDAFEGTPGSGTDPDACMG
jgi:hypothetical protein